MIMSTWLRRKRSFLLFCALAAGAFALGPPAQAEIFPTKYRVYDLTDLCGETTTGPTEALGINNLGQVVGRRKVGSYFQAVTWRWHEGNWIVDCIGQLEDLTDRDYVANAVNDNGVVVGYCDGQIVGRGFFATLGEAGTWQPVSIDPTIGETRTQALGIKASSSSSEPAMAVGIQHVSSPNPMPLSCVMSANTSTLDIPADFQSSSVYPRDANRSGQIAGYGVKPTSNNQTYACYWDADGTAHGLPDLSGYSNYTALAISSNATPYIVGSMGGSQSSVHAFVFQDLQSAPTALGLGQGRDVNSSNWILLRQGPNGSGGGVGVAWMEGTTKHPLYLTGSAVEVVGTSMTLEEPWAINDLGQIVGSGTKDVSGQPVTRPFLAVPFYANDKTVSFSLALGDYGGSATVVAYTLRQGKVDIASGTLSASGSASSVQLATKLRGKVDLRLKASHWLAKFVALDLPSNDDPHTYGGGTVTLVNGDVDGDNHVTIYDYNILSDAFDSTPSDPNWSANADLDGDGTVTVYDYNILSAHFGERGAY